MMVKDYNNDTCGKLDGNKKSSTDFKVSSINHLQSVAQAIYVKRNLKAESMSFKKSNKNYSKFLQSGEENLILKQEYDRILFDFENAMEISTKLLIVRKIVLKKGIPESSKEADDDNCNHVNYRSVIWKLTLGVPYSFCSNEYSSKVML
jgi:hypothetical protein